MVIHIKETSYIIASCRLSPVKRLLGCGYWSDATKRTTEGAALGSSINGHVDDSRGPLDEQGHNSMSHSCVSWLQLNFKYVMYYLQLAIVYQ